VSSHVVVRPQAEAELLAARDWYDAQRVGLGQQFVDEVVETMQAVATRSPVVGRSTGRFVGPSCGVSRTVCSFVRPRPKSSFSVSFTGGDIPGCGGPDSEGQPAAAADGARVILRTLY
jgi:hypothetical protein